MPYSPPDDAGRWPEFDEIQVGAKATWTHELTRADVEAFAALTGDYNPLHMDPGFARQTLFRRPVVHGMLSAAFISSLIGMRLPGQGALWVSQSLEFLLPAYVGDTLHVEATVKQKSPALRALVLEIHISNQQGQKLISGEATVKLPERMAEEAAVNTHMSQTILITGGGRGIGAAVARELAQQGHAVVVNYVQAAESAERLAQEITDGGGRAVAVRADVSRADDVAALFALGRQSFGAIHGVVHCAASGSRLLPLERLEWDDLQRQYEVQVKGAFLCAKAALPEMVAAESGALVFIGSIAAEGVPPAQQADYVTAKSALAALARCLAVEYGPKGIRVNVVSPGMTQTDLIAPLPDKAKLLTRMQTPLRRLAEPLDVAHAVAFLLSPAARHITGETLRVCGGAVMQ